VARLIAAHKREQMVYTMELAEQVSAEAAAAAGTQFTGFTGTKVLTCCTGAGEQVSAEAAV
jgi:hypothetical protein